MTRLHKLAALAAVLAAGALAPPALAYPQAAPGTLTAHSYQDLRSPDARDAALHPQYPQRRTVPQPPTWPRHPQVLTPSTARHTPASGGGGGLGTAPLAGILAAVALAAAALAAGARRRQARPVA
ncbi:MAG TPA: hypothetical protein VH418_09340 [Solirubrobacteraceae bacterium]|jgi:hypothetical protein